MTTYYRRLLVAPAAWRSAAKERAALTSERDELKIENESLLRRIEWITRELADITASMRELRAAVLARQNAQAELVELYRQREIVRAQGVERDPALPLQ